MVMWTFGQLLDAKSKVLQLIDEILEGQFTEYVWKLLPHLSNDIRELEEKYLKLLQNRENPNVKDNLHRLICSVSTHNNLDSHSLMEACISIQAAKAQNILNVKRLQQRSSQIGDGRIIPKLEASRLYKNENVVWARFVVSEHANVEQLAEELLAIKFILIADQVIEMQWVYRKKDVTTLSNVLSHPMIERIIFYSDMILVRDNAPSLYITWSNMLSFYYCYINDSIDVHVESDKDWEKLLSMSILTRLFLSKPNLRLFGGNDTPIACMSGYNPYRSLRKLSTQQDERLPNIHQYTFNDEHTPFNQGVKHPVYELSSNRDLQSVTGRSSIGGLNATELILHHVNTAKK